MTRGLFIGAVVLGGLAVVLFLGGLMAGQTGLSALSFLCVGPLFLFVFGAALGRASNEFSITRKDQPARPGVAARVVNSRLNREVLG